MAWLESHQTLLRHPKTMRAASLLGIPEVHLVGHLHAFWWWCLDYADDGDISSFTATELGGAAAWQGDAELFVDALTTAGFLDASLSGLTVHDWDDYAGKLVQQRAANAERQRRFRERRRDVPVTSQASRREPAQAECDVTDTSPLRNGATVPNLTGPTQQDPTQPDQPTAPEALAARARAREPRRVNVPNGVVEPYDPPMRSRDGPSGAGSGRDRGRMTRGTQDDTTEDRTRAARRTAPGGRASSSSGAARRGYSYDDVAERVTPAEREDRGVSRAPGARTGRPRSPADG